MNLRATSVEIPSARIAGSRLRCLGESVADFCVVPAVRSEESAPAADSSLWLVSRSADLRAGEYWETLSYLVLLFCGLIAIAFCLL